MKKTLLTIIFLYASVVQGQSKIETENWIEQIMNTYDYVGTKYDTRDPNSPLTTGNKMVDVDGKYFVFSYIIYKNGKFYDGSNFKIDLTKISSINIKKDYTFSYNYEFICKKNQKCVESISTDTDKSSYSYFKDDFGSYLIPEFKSDNLPSRLQKALQNLLSFNGNTQGKVNLQTKETY